MQPAFSPNITEYTIIGNGDTLQLSFNVGAGVECVITYGGEQFTTCDISSKSFLVSRAPSPLTLTLLVSTDSPSFNLTYTMKLRKIGCFVDNLLISSFGGLSNCSMDNSTYPISATCLGSTASSVGLSFYPFESCNVQIVSSSSTFGASSCESSFKNSSFVSTNCSAASGTSQLTIIASDPNIPTYNSTVATISFVNGSSY